jgi:hypothetical protein
MKLRVLITGLIFGVAAVAADNGAELFQKAVTQERAAGNLEEAIKLYQRVAKEFASDRALAAKALVQEARCYEKLGQDKAVKVYEQVARDFGDQREFAATASARLAVLRQGERPAATVPATMTQRKIELPYPSNSFQSFYQTDGQRIIYKDDVTGAMMINDLGGKDKRVIFKPKGDSLNFLEPSRDFSMVLMELRRPDGSVATAVIKTDGTGYREIGIDSQCDEEWSCGITVTSSFARASPTVGDSLSGSLWPTAKSVNCERPTAFSIGFLQTAISSLMLRTLWSVAEFLLCQAREESPDGLPKMPASWTGRAMGVIWQLLAIAQVRMRSTCFR